MKCPYYGGIEKNGTLRCGKDCLGYQGDSFRRKLDTCCVGESERDHCRPFLYLKCEKAGLIETPWHGSTEELRNIYLENIDESNHPDMTIQESTETTENPVLQSTAKEVEENSMSEEMEKAAPAAEISTRRQYAEKLHNKIMYDADMVASYLIELCKDLKRMRDEKYFTEMGFDTFDDYVEKDVGLKKRQAYTYISTYEKLGDTFLQSNAKLGITKLAMLTEVPAVDRPDFADNNDLEGMSTRQIKELVEKSKQQGEQISLLTSERDDAKTRADDAAGEADKAKKSQEDADRARLETDRKLKEAQSRADALAQENENLKNAEPDAATLDKFKKEAEKKAKKKYADKLNAETVKAVAAYDELTAAKVKAAREEGEKAAAEALKKSLEATEKEKADAIARAEKLEKELKVTGNKEMTMFAYLFEQFQQDFNKLCGIIIKVDASDHAAADTLRGAVGKIIEVQKENEALTIK